MRVIFSFFGINVSVVLILVTLASSLINNERCPIWHQRILKTVFFYSYIVCGPALVCLCVIALTGFSDSLLFVCDPIKGKRGQSEIHYQNLIQLSIALGVSICTSFIFTLFYVIYTMRIEFSEENSMISRIYYKSLRIFGPWFSSGNRNGNRPVNLIANNNNYGGVEENQN